MTNLEAIDSLDLAAVLGGQGAAKPTPTPAPAPASVPRDDYADVPYALPVDTCVGGFWHTCTAADYNH